MAKKKPLIRTNIFLSVEERDEFTRRARIAGTSAASLIRMVLDGYLGIDPTPVKPIDFTRRVRMIPGSAMEPTRTRGFAAPAK